METLKQVECQRCGGKWFPRVEKPKRCCYCGVRNWDTYKKDKESKEIKREGK